MNQWHVHMTFHSVHLIQKLLNYTFCPLQAEHKLWNESIQRAFYSCPRANFTPKEAITQNPSFCLYKFDQNEPLSVFADVDEPLIK